MKHEIIINLKVLTEKQREDIIEILNDASDDINKKALEALQNFTLPSHNDFQRSLTESFIGEYHVSPCMGSICEYGGTRYFYDGSIWFCN